MNFKAKIYLPANKEVCLVNGHAFITTFTRWTFGLFEERQVRERSVTKTEELSAYYTYCRGRYVDGSRWSLFGIDGCVGLEDTEEFNEYEIFQRALKGLPLYDTKPVKERHKDDPIDVFKADEVSASFPLALEWGGAVIDGRDYYLDEATGELKSVTRSKRMAIDSLWLGLQEQKQAAEFAL